MKRAAILYFSARGAGTAEIIARSLEGAYTPELHRPPEGGLKPLVKSLFGNVEALIFIGACGIAVRGVAPFLECKLSDPAVIVADEKGKYIISLLSGHVGGANSLARKVASAIGGVAVVTTATDVNRRFAADAWAAEKGLLIESPRAAKLFSTEILKMDLPFYSDFPIEGALPGGLFPGHDGDCGLLISYRKLNPFDMTLSLIPRVLHLGVGCKKGASAQKIGAAVETTLAREKINPRAVASVASVDMKRSEQGLIDYCREQGLAVAFYSAGQLNTVPGIFSSSEFVRNTVGVDNVCERAAMLSAGQKAWLLVKKTCLDGVTVAVAQENWSVCFE